MIEHLRIEIYLYNMVQSITLGFMHSAPIGRYHKLKLEIRSKTISKPEGKLQNIQISKNLNLF